MKPYYRIETRVSHYGTVHISGQTNGLDGKDFHFKLNAKDSQLSFIENWLGSKYLDEAIDGNTIFFVTNKIYTKVSKYVEEK